MGGSGVGATVDIAVVCQGHRFKRAKCREAKANEEILQRVVLAALGALTSVGYWLFAGPLQFVGDPPQAIVQP